MSMIMDAKAAAAVQGAINVSGQAAWMIPGGFTLGGASGNQPIGYDPEVLRPFVVQAAEPLSRGQVNMGGQYAPITHPQAAYYIGLYKNALALVGERSSSIVVPAATPGWSTHEIVAVPDKVAQVANAPPERDAMLQGPPSPVSMNQLALWLAFAFAGWLLLRRLA